MAVFTPHLYLTFGGYLGTSPSNPGEIWQCGLRIASNALSTFFWEPEAPREADQLALATAAQPLLSTWMTSTGTDFTAAAKLTWIKCAAISTDGSYSFDAPGLIEDLNLSGGGSVSTQKPYQVARVLSMGGDRNRGRASRGRIYTPSPVGTVDINNVSSGTVARDRFATLINGLNDVDLPTIGGEARYARVGLFSSVGGESQQVSRVGVDSKFDIQRRRADQIDTVIAWTDVAE